MIVLKKGERWGWALHAVLDCGHVVELQRDQIDAEGRVKDRLGCPECRRVFDSLRLGEWAS